MLGRAAANHQKDIERDGKGQCPARHQATTVVFTILGSFYA